MKYLEDLLKKLGKKIVKRKVQRANEELKADVNMRLYLAGHDTSIPVKEYTLVERVAINHMDSVYNLVERIIPKKYLTIGEESLNEPTFSNYTNKDHS